MERRNLHVRVSVEAYEAWRSFAAEHGVTLSALTEALGVFFASGDPISEQGAEIIAMAREIDQRHRSRRGSK
jgi:hypothetical protein